MRRPSHIVSEEYSNINVQFLPPNTTCKLQPLDQGVLRIVKIFYRKMLGQTYLAGIETGDEARKVIRKNFNLKIACDMISKCWKKVKPSLVENCFSKAGFIAGPVQREDPEDVQIERNLWDCIQGTFNVNLTFEDFATADDDVASTEHLSDAQIIEKVQADQGRITPDVSDDDDTSDSEEVEDNAITNSTQILTITPQIRAFFQQNKLNTTCLDELEHLVINSKLTRQTHQRSISQFIQS